MSGLLHGSDLLTCDIPWWSQRFCALGNVLQSGMNGLPLVRQSCDDSPVLCYAAAADSNTTCSADYTPDRLSVVMRQPATRRGPAYLLSGIP